MESLKATILRVNINGISLKFLERNFPSRSRVLAQVTLASEGSAVCATESVDYGSGNLITWSTPLSVPLHASEFTIRVVAESGTDSAIDIGSVVLQREEIIRRLTDNPHITRRLQGGWKAELSWDISASPGARCILVFLLALQWIHDLLSSSVKRMLETETGLKEGKTLFLNEPSILSLSSNVYKLSNSHPRKAHLLNLLGDVYWHRYLTPPHNTSDLDQAIHAYADAVELAVDDDVEKAGHLNDLAAAHLRRFEQLAKSDDLDAALKRFSESLDFTLDDDKDKPLRLSNYGNALTHHFKLTGDEGSLNKAVDVQRQAMDVATSRATQQSHLVHNLATSLDLKFGRYGKLEDLNESIALHEQAVESCTGEQEKLIYLTTLSNALYNRFQRKGVSDDLDRVIQIREDVVERTQDDNLAKPGRLNNLANAFLRRFEHKGDIADLEISISKLEHANNLTADEHPDKLSRLNNLASSYIRRYDRISEPMDLDNALVLFEDLVRRTPETHPERPARLATFAGAITRRFELANSDVNDINRAVELQEEAVRLTPEDSAKRPSRINALANFLRRRFERLANVEDIHRSISNAESAVKLTAADNPEKFGFLNILGVSLASRFDTLGSIDDINRSISVLRMSVRLTGNTDREKPARLGSLAASLWSRFKRLGDVGDLKEAVQAYEMAVVLTPKDHPSRAMRLNNFGNALTRRFRRLNNVEDINRSIKVKEEALQLLPVNNPHRVYVVDSLANSLFRRYEVTSQKEDIDRSILLHEESINNTPEIHPSRPARLSNLGNSLSIRFEKHKDIADVDRAIVVQEDAVSSTVDGNLNKVAFLINLGNSYARRFGVTGSEDDLKHACLNFSFAAKSHTGSSVIKFRACSHWARYARIMHSDANLLDIYEHAVGVLPQLAWLGLPITDRFHHLMEAGRVIRDGASIAIQAGELTKAVEWLEQGRSVIWGQLLQLRSPLDKLHDIRPDLADNLMRVSRQLEGTAVDSQLEIGESVQREDADEYHSLTLERDNLVLRIRSEVEGFERFLLPRSFRELTTSLPGPVVIVNVSSIRCDAIVVTSKVPAVKLVSLPDMTLSKAQTMHKYLRMLITSPGRSINQELHVDSRSSSIAPGGITNNKDAFAKLLSFIWTLVVKPITNDLGLSNSSRNPPRIWWCPTGPLSFLPLHAAGIYRGGSLEAVSEYVISSYTPTLSALQADKDSNTINAPFRVLAVVQASAAGQSPLPGTQEELKQIKQCMNSTIAFEELVGSDATVQKVSEGMKNANWVHFACHGVQDLTDPTQSALLLAGKPSKLTLSKIIGLSLPNAQLAFLSACQTATGDADLVEESVHLAAGMLSAGYKGVIATLWSIKDRDAPLVAEAVYSYMLGKDSSPPEFRDAAQALHFAIQRLKERTGSSFASWIPYVHIGM